MGGLYVAQLAQGVGSGLLWVAVLSVVSDLAPADSRGTEYGRVEEMAFRGTLLGSLVGFALLYLLSRDDFAGGLTLIGGWRVLFFGFTAATLVAAAIAWHGVPETLQHSGARPATVPAVPKDQSVEMAEKWHLPSQLRILLGIVVFTAIASGILSPILIPHLSDSVSADMFTIALAFLPAALAGSRVPSRLGGLSDRFGRRPPLIIALLVGGLTALAVPLVHSLWPLALMLVFEAAAFAAATPAEEALVVDISGDERQGTALGYYTAAAGLGGVIGPLMGGWLYDRFAAFGAFGVSALLMALGAVLILLFVREPSRGKVDCVVERGRMTVTTYFPAIPVALPAGAPPAFHLLAKPTGAICNLDCAYCFFLDKEVFYPGSKFRMSDDVLEQYIRQLIESHRTDSVNIAWQGASQP